MATITYTYVQGYLSPANGDDEAKIIYSNYIDWSDNAIVNKEGDNIITTSDLTTYISNSISNIISSYENADVEINDKLEEIIESYTAADADIIDTLNNKPGKFDPKDSNKINGTYTGEIFNDYITNKAYSKYSHVEGNKNISYSIGGHIEGGENIAGSESTIDDLLYAYAHAEGFKTNAIGQAAHSEGIGTIANGEAQHVQGKYNKIDRNQAFIIGNGTNDNNRSNALTVDWNGNLNINNKFNIKEFDNTKTFLDYTESGIYYYDDNNNLIDIVDIPEIRRISNFILIVTSGNNVITQSLITSNKEYKRSFSIRDNNINKWEEIQTISNLDQIEIKNTSDINLNNPLNNLTYDGTYYGNIKSSLITNVYSSSEILNTYQYLQDGSKFLMTIINNDNQCMQTLNILPKTRNNAIIDGYQIFRTGIYIDNEIQWGEFKPMDGVGKISNGLCSEIFNDYSNNIAYGSYSHVEGSNNIAYGSNSHVSGYNNISYGSNSHVSGYNNISYGSNVIVSGNYNINGLDINGNLGTVKNYNSSTTKDFILNNTPYKCVFEIDNFNGYLKGNGETRMIQFISLDNKDININNSKWDTISDITDNFDTSAVVKIIYDSNNKTILYAYTNANQKQNIYEDSIIVFKDKNFDYNMYPKITSDNSLLIGSNNRNYDYTTNPQFVSGRYNKIDFNKARITGWGEADNNRKNIETLDTNGNLWVAGDIKCGTNNITSISDINKNINNKPGKVVDYTNEIYNDLYYNEIYGQYNHIEGSSNKAKIGVKKLNSYDNINTIDNTIDINNNSSNINIDDFIQPIVYIHYEGNVESKYGYPDIYRSISFTYYTNPENNYDYQNAFMYNNTFAYIIVNDNSEKNTKKNIKDIYAYNDNIIKFEVCNENNFDVENKDNILKHILYAYLKFPGDNANEVNNNGKTFVNNLINTNSCITNSFYNNYSNLTDDNSLKYLDLKNIHIEGNNNIGISNNQHISGKYNEINQDAVRITGWGEDEFNRKNIETLDTNGNLWVAGDITSYNVSTGDITSNTVSTKDITSNTVSTKDITAYNVSTRDITSTGNITSDGDITSNNVKYSYELASGDKVILTLDELTEVINSILGTNISTFAGHNATLQNYMTKVGLINNQTT